MEKSESGSPIYRYTNEDKNEFKGAGGDSSMEEISDHIEAHIGEIHMVFHEIVSEQVHIDVHWVKPTKEHPFHTLITSGMSDKPMNTPRRCRRMRLCRIEYLLARRVENIRRRF